MTLSALLSLCLLALVPGLARASGCSDSCRRTSGSERPGGPILSQFVDCIASCGDAVSTGTLRGMSDQDLEAALNEQMKHAEIVLKSCDIAKQVGNAAALAVCPKASKRLQKAIDAVRDTQATRTGKPRPGKKGSAPAARKPPAKPAVKSAP